MKPTYKSLALLAVLKAVLPSHQLPLMPDHSAAQTTFITLPVKWRCIDCSEDVRGCDLACLAKNVAYVGRYYSSTDAHKTLSRDEGLSISKRGMRILVFFQNGARTKRSFGAALGERNRHGG